MGREINRLTARTVATLKKPGRHADGNGLYLVVGPGDSRRWVVFINKGKKRIERGIGSAGKVTLAEARRRAQELRSGALTDSGGEEASPETFGDVARRYMAAREHTWRNAVHRRQWHQTLEEHGRSIWKKPVAEIDTADVLEVLRPLWAEKTETARRLRGRIEKVIDAAKVEGLRSGENPARWVGHLALILPKPKKLAARGHHAALPWQDLPAFLAKLRLRSAPSALALEFLILTAARSGEVRGMQWCEIDTAAALWTVPADRMKAGRTHRVPLPKRALEIVENMRPLAKRSELVFPNRIGGECTPDAFLRLLERMGAGDSTPHGFRSTFRDWAGDETDFPREVIEAALAHQVGGEVERAYRRSDALEKRRALMDAWEGYALSKIAAGARKGVFE